MLFETVAATNRVCSNPTALGNTTATKIAHAHLQCKKGAASLWRRDRLLAKRPHYTPRLPSFEKVLTSMLGEEVNCTL